MVKKNIKKFSVTKQKNTPKGAQIVNRELFGSSQITLFYVQYHDKEKSSVTSKRQWNGDKKMQQQILQSLHDGHAGGCHFGRDKTRDKVASRYGQYDDVDYYIKICERCQKLLHVDTLH